MPDLRRLAACSLTLLLCACSGGSGSTSAAPAAAPESGQADTAPANPPPATVITVLALYTPGVATLYPDVDLRVLHLFNVANDVLASNGAGVELELVHLERVDYPDGYGMPTALEAVTLATHPAFAGVAALRDETGADLVALLRPYPGDGYCGYAWIGGHGTGGDFSHPAEPDFAYSAVAVDCADYTLLHELGHNLGLAHSRREAADGGSLPYGVGHGEDNNFVTIMASPGAFNATRLPALANPDRLCNGSPCGVPESDPARGANAWRALAVSRDQVAGYR